MTDSIAYIANAVAEARERGNTIEDARKIFQQYLFRDYKLRIALSDLFVVRMWNGDGVGMKDIALNGKANSADPSPHQSDGALIRKCSSKPVAMCRQPSEPLSEAGITSVAVNGHSTCATVSETPSSERARCIVPNQGLETFARPDDTQSSGDSIDRVPNGLTRDGTPSASLPTTVTLVREHIRFKPGTAKRLGARMDSAHKILNERYLETLVIDGQPLGEWTIDAAEKVGTRKTFEGRVLLTCVAEVRSHYADVRGNQTFAEVLRSDDVERIVNDARETIAA